uniref:Uncharacterized protein n=1 Tax=Theropithecus gelada TaxID=9565 RepID=A0A8D2FLW1_THEGE
LTRTYLNFFFPKGLIKKNMKKQKNTQTVKGKCQDDGFSPAAHKQRDLEIMEVKQKRENEKEEEPK